jgi:hypothetical protein
VRPSPTAPPGPTLNGAPLSALCQMLVARAALRLLSASAGVIPTTSYVLTEGVLEFVVPSLTPKFIYGPALEAVEELSEPQGTGHFSLACPPQQPQLKYRAGFAFVEGAMRDCPGSAMDRAGAAPVLAK